MQAKKVKKKLKRIFQESMDINGFSLKASKDPIIHNIKRDPDLPDIDLDFIPESRDKIKNFAASKYGSDKVCSVGSWQTYNPKSALQDVARSLGHKNKLRDIMDLNASLPVEFDDMTFETAINEFQQFKKWCESDKDNMTIARMAFKLVGKIKTQGRHAGGLIISNVALVDNIPLAKMGDQWTSEWTEGQNVQLSKFGYVKYDVLGLKTLEYIWRTEQLVKRDHNIEIDWNKIGYSDELALKMANDVKTDSIFQFDTDIAKRILAKGGTKSFNDLMVYTSLGRPGPMPMIDDYIARRDDPSEAWKKEEHHKVAELLKDTYGICVYQEQLTAFWTTFCGFTIPEADRARKVIAKKWIDKLPEVQKKVIDGATKSLGAKYAEIYWQRLSTFGRYAFNKSHAVAYTQHAYKCLYLKSHYPEEWWCGVLNACNADKIPQYIGVARTEGIKFGTMDFNNLSKTFDVINNKIIPGLLGVKGIGDKSISDLDTKSKHKSIDEFINSNQVNKTVVERLIKLGAFDSIHKNRKALWYWYLYKHSKTKDGRDIRNELNELYKWSDDKIQAERDRQIKEYFKLYPNRKKIPKKMENWTPKISLTIDQVFDAIKHDYTYEQRLSFQKEYLGYHWDSPMDLYMNRNLHIKQAKSTGKLECVIVSTEYRTTKSDKQFMTMRVTDGSDTAKIQIWENTLKLYPKDYFEPNAGIYVEVDWNEQFKSFNLLSDEILKLNKIDESENDVSTD